MRRGFGFNAHRLSLSLLAALADDFGISVAQLTLRYPDLLLSAALTDDSTLDAILTARFNLIANLADDLGISAATLTVRYPDLLLTAPIADDLGISRAVLTAAFPPALLAAALADDLGLSATLSTLWKLNANITDDAALTAILSRNWNLQAAIADDLGISRAVLTRAWKLQAAIADDLGVSRAVLTRLWKLRALIADDTGLAATLTRAWKLRALLADDLGISLANLTLSNPAFTVNFLEDVTTTTTTANLSFATRTLGAADPNRFIVIGIHSGNNARTITSVTIGGVAATQLNHVAANTQTIAMYYALVPTGTTGTIAINRSSADNALQFGTWRVVSPTGLINVADVSICASPATQGNQVQNCRQGGTIFGILSATSPTITNFGIESGPDAGGCYMLRHPVVSGDGTSFTGNITSSTAIRLALASLYP